MTEKQLHALAPGDALYSPMFPARKLFFVELQLKTGRYLLWDETNLLLSFNSTEFSRLSTTPPLEPVEPASFMDVQPKKQPKTMTRTIELLPPHMPNFIQLGGADYVVLPGTQIAVSNLTEEEAIEYADLMRDTFLAHWKNAQ